MFDAQYTIINFSMFSGVIGYLSSDRMFVYAEKDVSTSQGVTGAYFNKGIFSGVVSSWDPDHVH
jgi:hypothetical protein